MSTSASASASASASPLPPPHTHSTSAPTNTLRILTLNVWGLKYISKLRSQRILQIASLLHSPHTPQYDLICLQEIWYESVDFRHLQSFLSSRYPYAKFFLSGAFGSGLAILSRHPILETCTHPYSLNGLPIHVQHGDWFVGKACGAVTVEIEGLGLVDVWNTHFVAAGGDGGAESERAHRITQAYELATNARKSAKRGRHTVVCGDLNSTPPSLCLALLREVGGLFDGFVDSRPEGTDPLAVELPASTTTAANGQMDMARRTSPDPERALEELGVTCDSPLNTWTAGKRLDIRAQRGAGKRLDYVLYRGPETSSCVAATAPTTAYEAKDSSRGRLRCSHSRVVFTDVCSNLNVSLSDHFGVEAVFDILPAPSDSDGIDETHLPTTARARTMQATLTSAMKALAGGHAKSRTTQRNHFYLFATAVFVAVASIVASVFQPLASVNPILVLLAVVAGWAGTTMLYSAVVWAEWEKRTLRTVLEMMELEIAQMRRLATLRPFATPDGSSSTGSTRPLQSQAVGRVGAASVSSSSSNNNRRRGNGSPPAPVHVQEGTLF